MPGAVTSYLNISTTQIPSFRDAAWVASSLKIATKQIRRREVPHYHTCALYNRTAHDIVSLHPARLTQPKKFIFKMCSTHTCVFMSRRGELMKPLASGEKAVSISAFNISPKIHIRWYYGESDKKLPTRYGITMT